jgi:hypothetical protein
MGRLGACRVMAFANTERKSRKWLGHEHNEYKKLKPASGESLKLQRSKSSNA